VKLNDHFKSFLGNISLNPTREDRIRSALSTWEDIFEDDEKIKVYYEDFYKQGSYAIGTAIIPTGNNEFDVDTVLLLDTGDEFDPKGLIDFVYNRMKEKEAYRDKLIKKDRCIRVNYVGDFHMDVVPAKPTDDEHILISCKSTNEWVETNPAGYVRWFRKANRDHSGKLVNLTKIVKYWRDNKVGSDTAPKSILLTTLIAQYSVTENSEAETLVLTLENMVNNIDEILVNNEPYVENPSLAGENLARDWDRKKYDTFKVKLEKFSKDSRASLDEVDKDKSIQKWQDIFGDKFPSEISEAENVSKMIKTGTIVVDSNGSLNTNNGQRVPPNRYFGC
jgi:hypothetical protein